MDGLSEQRLARLERSQEEIRDEITAQGGLLRTLLERTDEIIRLLTPAPSDGPTLEELLAQMVAMINDQGATLKRLDVRSARKEHLLPLDVVTALRDNLGLERAAQS